MAMKNSNEPSSAAGMGQDKAIFILKPMTVGAFADVAKVSAGEVILFLLRKGISCSRNQLLQEGVVADLARHYGFEVVKSPKISRDQDELVIEHEGGAQESRSPIVVVVGHVDHGKTTLLDYIRKTRVAQKEKGGITQHLGAYRVTTGRGDIVFLDTPGHEAFMRMRERGLKVADLAILMVAADDGIMPQTLEALNAAKAANVPIIVALNKVDKVDQKRIDMVKQQLAKYGLSLDEWGGDVICVPISAKEGTGVDKLLEMVHLQAEMLELKARVTGPGIGYVLETKLEKGRGTVATLILQHGIVRVGDFFVAGVATGKINVIMDSFGVLIKEVMPGNPVQIAGFDEMPQAGDIFRVITAAEYKERKSNRGKFPELTSFLPQAEDKNALVIMLKADTDSSKDALTKAIEKLAGQEKETINIIQAGVGAITESDVAFAATAHATIYGFGVKPEAYVQLEAKRLNVPVFSFYVIYHLLDDIKERIEKARKPEVVSKKVGEAVVRKVFDIKGEIIAGCYVKTGKFVRDGKVVVLRDGRKIGEAKIKTLQRERRSMKEVAAGYECAFIAEGLSDFQIEDTIECYQEVEVPKE